jgi:beta-glucosidase-like glycosyl hydrolase
MPTVSKSYEELQEIDWLPYKHMIGSGLKAIMGAHINLKIAGDNLPATLSRTVINDWLRGDLGFGGLLVTDALDMKGISDNYEAGELERKAAEAGNDMLLYPSNLAKGVEAIQKALGEGTLSEQEIDQKCLRIMEAKEWAKLFNPQKPSGFPTKEQVAALNRKVCEASLTLLGKKAFEVNEKSTLVNLTAANQTKTTYTSMPHHNFEQGTARNGFQQLADLLGVQAASAVGIEEVSFSAVQNPIVCFHGMAFSAAIDFGLSSGQIKKVEALLENPDCQLLIFGNPYVLQLFPNWRNAEGVLVVYQESGEAIQTVAKFCKGEIAANGHLPINL